MQGEPLVILGTGGFGREIRCLVDDINAESQRWHLVGFLDDDLSLKGRVVDGLPVLGGAEWLKNQTVHVALGVGSPATRRRIVAALKQYAQFPTLVHPTVVASSRVEIGVGTVITAGNILTTNVRLGAHVIVNLACTIGHDVRVGDYVTIAPGSNISGNVSIGEGADIGTGVKVIQGEVIGGWSVVGAGAVVTSDVPANVTCVGVPAKVIKRRPEDWQLS